MRKMRSNRATRKNKAEMQDSDQRDSTTTKKQQQEDAQMIYLFDIAIHNVVHFDVNGQTR